MPLPDHGTMPTLRAGALYGSPFCSLARVAIEVHRFFSVFFCPNFGALDLSPKS